MTAVPAERRKTKDPFQLELDKEIAKRRSRGLKTGSPDEDSNDGNKSELSDEYEDDFDVGSDHGSDEELYQQFLNESSSENSVSVDRQPKLTSKKVEKVEAEKNEKAASFLGKSPPSFLSRQAAFDEKQTKNHDDASNMEDDPLLKFLQRESKARPLTPEAAKEDDFGVSIRDRPSSAKKKVTFSSSRDGLDPKTEEPSSTLHTPNHVSPGKLISINKDGLSPKAATLSTFPQNSLDDLLRDVKPRAAPRKASNEDILKPHPKARRRHDSNRSSMSEESQTRASTKSPVLSQVQEEKEKKSSETSKLLNYDVSKFPSLSQTTMRSTASKSSEFTTTKGETVTEIPKKESVSIPEKTLPVQTQLKKKNSYSESDDMTSSAEDLLAQLSAAVNSSASAEKKSKDSPPKVDSEQTETVAVKLPVEDAEVVETDVTPEVDQSTFTYKHESQEKDALSELTLKRPVSGKRPSSRKSPRTPSANYKGLGSLHGLQQLSTFRATESGRLKSTTDVRSTVYMQWLADREKKLRAKKKHLLEEEEKENERKEKEQEERLMEGESARKAWLEKKKIILKEQEQKKKKEEKRKERQKEKEKEDKKKSSEKADIVREKALEKARERHREEMKKKRKEEKQKEKEENEKKEKNETKLNEWMEKRSKQWEKDRKIEIREKKAKEREVKKAKESKIKDAEDSYMKWREKKEQQDHERRHVNRHYEDRPVWSPANKVIPRVR